MVYNFFSSSLSFGVDVFPNQLQTDMFWGLAFYQETQTINFFLKNFDIYLKQENHRHMHNHHLKALEFLIVKTVLHLYILTTKSDGSLK